MPASSPSTVTHDPVLDDRGDFVDSDYETDIEDESEDSFQYLLGHFYPVCIGDLLKERYQVIHKLGRGGFSTVWLAHDQESGQDVALKILSSSAEEYKQHSKISQRVRDRSRLVLCLDKFQLSRRTKDVEHRYNVLVLPLRGPSLKALQQGTKIPLARRMSAAKQLLQAVLSIHDAGLVHRGKLHTKPSFYMTL